MIGGAHSGKEEKNAQRGIQWSFSVHGYRERRKQPYRKFRKHVSEVSRSEKTLPPYTIVDDRSVQPFGKNAEQRSRKQKYPALKGVPLKIPVTLRLAYFFQCGGNFSRNTFIIHLFHFPNTITL